MPPTPPGGVLPVSWNTSYNLTKKFSNFGPSFPQNKLSQESLRGACRMESYVVAGHVGWREALAVRVLSCYTIRELDAAEGMGA